VKRATFTPPQFTQPNTNNSQFSQLL